LRDQVLCESGKEAGNVGFLHDQVERQLRRLILDVSHALRALALARELAQRPLELSDSVGRSTLGDVRSDRR